ncbi:MAG: hypothetical protein INQ03_25160 [Candidatus Heimdallarchaeota archaeon]|nr:hypothetical protein [Candidatus Heimdallarchaeota archaeon]
MKKSEYERVQRYLDHKNYLNAIIPILLTITVIVAFILIYIFGFKENEKKASGYLVALLIGFGLFMGIMEHNKDNKLMKEFDINIELKTEYFKLTKDKGLIHDDYLFDPEEEDFVSSSKDVGLVKRMNDQSDQKMIKQRISGRKDYLQHKLDQMIADLPKHRLNKGEYKNESCVFCKTSLNNYPTYTFKCCNYSVHERHVFEWAQDNFHCPICKTPWILPRTSQ